MRVWDWEGLGFGGICGGFRGFGVEWLLGCGEWVGARVSGIWASY